MQPTVLRPTSLPLRPYLQDHGDAGPVETGNHHDVQFEHQDARSCKRDVCQEQRCYGCNQTLDAFNQICGEAEPLIFVDPAATSTTRQEVDLFLDFISSKDQP